MLILVMSPSEEVLEKIFATLLFPAVSLAKYILFLIEISFCFAGEISGEDPNT